MERNTVIGFILVLVLIVSGVVFIGIQTNISTNEREGVVYDTIPAFSLRDYSGTEVTPDDFRGKALVINVWATWCPFCVDELPLFATLQKEYADDIVVLAVDRGETAETAREYTDTLGITHELVFLLDEDDSFYRSVGGFSMPETLFVDAAGNIRLHRRGPMTLTNMRDTVRMLIE